jgi:hypothetical protein
MNVKKNIIVNFNIQKLNNKHISLKKYTNWAILGHVTQNLEFTSWTTSCEPMLTRYVDTSQIFIWDWDLNLGHKELEI